MYESVKSSMQCWIIAMSMHRFILRHDKSLDFHVMIVSHIILHILRLNSVIFNVYL